MSETLRASLEQKEAALELIMAIDHARDALPEPSAMLSAIANVVTDRLQADLCLLCLLDRETGELELKAVDDRGDQLNRLDPLVARELAAWVIESGGVALWEGGEVLPVPGRVELSDGLDLAAIPIIMGAEDRLGAVLLARSRGRAREARPYGPGDVELLRIAESQIDSAVLQCYAYYDLQQRNKELETIYRVDRIRDLQLPFDEMLSHVLREVQEVIQSEMGFIMLYNHVAERLELRAATDDDLFRVSPYHEAVDRAANDALRRGKMVCHNDLGDVLRSVLCIPLILRNEIIGVLGVVNRYGLRGFRDGDCRLLNAVGSQMDTAIFESLERRRLRQVLGRSVDPRVMERLLAKPDVDFLRGERSVLSVLYADVRGSTGLSERTDPELLVGFINEYLGRMTEVILSHEGTLDKFVGDEVMALFGAPFTQPDHALRAVRVGMEMQAAHWNVMEAWQARGVDPAPIGIGIASGEMTVGEMGCIQRTDYTVIGPPANLGSRICDIAGPGQVLVCQATYDLVREHVEAVPIAGLRLKGVGQDVTAYQVIHLRD
jgi:adenylate cyclase